MKPESDRFMIKARQLLQRAEKMLVADLAEDAGRSAYLAGYHAAQAFLFESSGKVAKPIAGYTRNLRG